jgi:hypothetical protein
MQDRRKFLETISLGSAGLAFAAGGFSGVARALAEGIDGSGYDTLTENLLKDWCDGMLALQVDDPGDPVRRGGLSCPSCDFIHGRCWEALYPFMQVAKSTGEKKYLDAAIKLFDWSKNVTGPDGCQPGFSIMASRNPAFGTAAFKNAELLARRTARGLLHGGPHFVSHGIKPCVHHTFAHAKVLAWVQDHKKSLPQIDKTTPLPRDRADGMKEFPELDVWLAARGPWRATVSGYD